MNDFKTIPIREYLDRKGIEYRDGGKELRTHCFFNGCDEDSRHNEYHLYFDSETGLHHCKKCDARGNMITLAKHFGDSLQDIALNPNPAKKSLPKTIKFDVELIEKCHQALPPHIRHYLNNRGIIDAIIDSHKLGWGWFYGKFWITIPIQDFEGVFRFFKLRQDPSAGNEKITYPKSTQVHPIEAQIYGWDTLKTDTAKIIICEGELDRLALLSKGIPAITSTHGAMTFKES